MVFVSGADFQILDSVYRNNTSSESQSDKPKHNQLTPNLASTLHPTYADARYVAPEHRLHMLHSVLQKKDMML